MKKENLWKKKVNQIWKGRTALGISLAVSAFLCALTVLELVENIILDEIQTAEKTQSSEMNVQPGAADLSESDVEIEGTERSEDDADIDVSETKENQNASKDETTKSPEQQTETPDLSETESLTNENMAETSDENPAENLEDQSGENLADNMEDDFGNTAEEEFPYYIKINRQQNCITIYEKDENGEYTVPVKAIICSTGLYNATPKGIFHLSTKYLWRQLHGGVYGQYATRITGGVLFHSVPYARKDKTTLYADKYNKLGQQASMGCVRLTVEDAKWISENCPSGTAVEVYDDEDPGPLGKPEAAKIDLDSPNKGWDPTDPDLANPWHELSEDE